MDAVKLMGEAVKKASELTADRQCIGAATVSYTHLSSACVPMR